MLTIKADGCAGMDIKRDLLPEMLRLAQLTDCAIEVHGNETTFIVYPNDNIRGLEAAYDRLYPKSTLVTSGMLTPLERKKT